MCWLTKIKRHKKESATKRLQWARGGVMQETESDASKQEVDAHDLCDVILDMWRGSFNAPDQCGWRSGRDFFSDDYFVPGEKKSEKGNKDEKKKSWTHSSHLVFILTIEQTCWLTSLALRNVNNVSIVCNTGAVWMLRITFCCFLLNVCNIQRLLMDSVLR